MLTTISQPAKRAARFPLCSALVFWTALLFVTRAAAAPLDLVVEISDSGGISEGAPVRSRGVDIGSVRSVGFGGKDVVEIGLRIHEKYADRVVTQSTFVVAQSLGESMSWLEHHVLDAASPPATSGTRFVGARSEAEVWLRRGRMSSEEMRKSLAKGVAGLREEIEELRSSQDWTALREELAKLAAELTTSGAEVSRMVEQSLPEIQRELEALYERYQKELEARGKTPVPGP